MNVPRIALVVSLAIGTAVAVLAPDRAVTPGVLSAGHRDRHADCLACHTLLQGPRPEKCVGCHRIPEIGVRTVAGSPRPRPNPRAQGLHAAIAPGACLMCHAEHDDGSGRRPRLRFTHALLTTERQAACAGCHLAQRPGDILHAQATATCTPCHGTTAWKPATFEHARYFRFDTDHLARCATCHPTAGDYRQYTCYGCHAHTPAETARQHRNEGVRVDDHCARCHRSSDEHEALRDPEPPAGDAARRSHERDREDRHRRGGRD